MRQSCFVSIVFLLLLAGCSSPSEGMRPVPITGGRSILIPFGPQGPRPGKADGYEVLHAGAAPGAQARQTIYQFACSAPPGAALQRIQVDDISEEQPSPLIDDQQPWLSENHLWHMDTAPLNADDPRLAWIYTVTPTMRVYRFTITDKAGHKSYLYQAVGYPDFIKSAIRRQWGEKY